MFMYKVGINVDCNQYSTNIQKDKCLPAAWGYFWNEGIAG